MHDASVIYHGHRDKDKPFSLVVRYGTHGATRGRVAAALATNAQRGPWATKAEAEAVRAKYPDTVRPFIDISRFHGYC